MSSIKLSNRKIRPKKGEEKKKESVIRQLVDLLREKGLSVRRERLPRGIGYKVASGQCRLREDNTLVLDRALPLEEQIAFLCGHFVEISPSEATEAEEGLPDSVRTHIARLRSSDSTVQNQ